MFNRLWLLFAQVITIFLAAWFITMILKPSWLNGIKNGSLVESITLKEGFYDGSSLSPGSYHEAVKKSMPAVVNIFTSKASTKPKSRKGNNSADPLFKLNVIGLVPPIILIAI